MKQAKRISSLSLLIIFAISCSENNNIDDERLAKAYVDLLIVEDYYSNSDSLAMKRSEVFQKYSMSEEKYDTAFVKISYDVERWENFFSLANEYLDTLKAQVKNGSLQELP